MQNNREVWIRLYSNRRAFLPCGEAGDCSPERLRKSETSPCEVTRRGTRGTQLYSESRVQLRASGGEAGHRQEVDRKNGRTQRQAGNLWPPGNRSYKLPHLPTSEFHVKTTSLPLTEMDSRECYRKPWQNSPGKSDPLSIRHPHTYLSTAIKYVSII